MHRTLKEKENGFLWGYQIESLERRYEWFKLGLDPSVQQDNSNLASKYPGSTGLPLQHNGRNTSPEELATEYLRALRRHAGFILSQTLPKAALNSIPREYIITVPALWTERARDLTSKCASRAGMGPQSQIHLISEPEAAAIYAFKEMHSYGLKLNDPFVLCDAGGGYYISHLSN